MSDSRTNRVFRNKFKATGGNNIGGYSMGKEYMTDSSRAKLIEEGKKRERLQCSIKKLVQNQVSVEKIKQLLNMEEYEEYIDGWITGWILRLNPNIKSIIVKSLNRGKEQEEILEKIRVESEEIYMLYKLQIQEFIKNEMEARQRNKTEKSRDEGR